MNDIFEYVEKHSMRINSQFRPEDPKKKKKKKYGRETEKYGIESFSK